MSIAPPARSPITTHVLDTQHGRPAAGIAVVLEQRIAADRWVERARGATNADGRVEGLLAPGSRAEPGTYRLVFETAAYFAALSVATFYPSVSITFQIVRAEEHHHVPLLLAAHGYTTYRGS